MARSLFIEVGSLTPSQHVTLLEKVRAARAAGADYVNNLVLTNICDQQGNLYIAQLDAIRPYLPGGATVACDNVFVGTTWKAWSPDAYGADKSQWYNHYSVWGGVLNESYRWAQINLNRKAWADFKARYNLPWMHFYISIEADLQAWGHEALGWQVSNAYEALLIQLCKDARAIEGFRSVMFSPFCWTPFSQVPAADRIRMKDAMRRVFINVERYSGMGINFLDLQDGVGARFGVTTPQDAAGLFALVKDSYGFASCRMNVEQFAATSAGFIPINTASREVFYRSLNIPIGACWEIRYWAAATAPAPLPVPSPVPFPKIEFLTRSQWGANASLPRLGFFVPAISRTEVHVHHTAAVDSDATPNRWTRGRAINYMRRLQTVRPDLGKDIPYTYVFFVLEDLSVLICEGRGLQRSGAHTAGHNTAGFGFSVAGNFDKVDNEARDAFLKVLKNETAYLIGNGYPNLAKIKNPRGWDLWGHRDSSPKSCPGNTLYPRLADIDVR